MSAVLWGHGHFRLIHPPESAVDQYELTPNRKNKQLKKWASKAFGSSMQDATLFASTFLTAEGQRLATAFV